MAIGKPTKSFKPGEQFTRVWHCVSMGGAFGRIISESPVYPREYMESSRPSFMIFQPKKFGILSDSNIS